MTTLIRSAIKRIPGARRLKRPLYFTQAAVFRLVHGDDYRKAIFKGIWTNNHWGDVESRSGTGSSLRETTQLRKGLANLLEALGVRHILDLPCGDFNWMKEIGFPSDLSYVGGDIVDQVIEQNQRRYGGEGKHFRSIDILRDPLPAVDLILCRDCLVHFSFADIFAAVANLKRSGSKYLLATHYTRGRQNSNIATGDWRPLDLTQPPIDFPRPLLMIDEQCSEGNGQYQDKCLGLWLIEDLPNHLS